MNRFTYKHHGFRLIIPADNARNAYKQALVMEKDYVCWLCDCTGATFLINDREG